MDRFTIRRNLLRGSLSAPLVLTVSSAGAARTTFSVCFVNSQVTGAPKLRAFTSPIEDEWGDTWYRVEITGRKVTADGATAISYYIKHPTTSSWYSAALSLEGVFTVGSTPVSEPTGGDSIRVAALALFSPTNPTGEPTGIAFFDADTGSITTKSCHCSVF